MSNKTKKTKANKKKFKFKLPALNLFNFFILLIIIVVAFFAIFIPVTYVNAYNDNKVVPFESDIANIDVVRGNKNTITDFEFVISCTSYDDTSGSATFKYYAYENENTKEKKVQNLEVKLGMFSDWIKVNRTSSSRSVTLAEDEEKALSSSTYYKTVSISSLPDLPKKASVPFVTIKSIPLSVFISYTTTKNGKQTTHNYIITYPYSEYIKGAAGGIV